MYRGELTFFYMNILYARQLFSIHPRLVSNTCPVYLALSISRRKIDIFVFGFPPSPIQKEKKMIRFICRDGLFKDPSAVTQNVKIN